MVRCLIIVNTYKEESQKMGAEIKSYLEKCGIRGDVFLFNGFCEQYPFSGYDFVITLGGDGTVLFAARGCAPEKIPIIPVNFGTFSFIASVQKNEWKEQLHQFYCVQPVREFHDCGCSDRHEHNRHRRGQRGDAAAADLQ